MALIPRLRASISDVLPLLLTALCVLVAPSGLSAQPAFGPTRYMRTTGPPQTFTDTFSRCGTAACQIVVVNGNADGTNRTSSAFVYLNGRLIIGPRDFNRRVDRIVRTVALGDQNELSVSLASAPGSFLTISVECETSPAILSLSGPGVNLLNPTMLVAAVPIMNTGTAAAQNVQVTALSLTTATLTSPSLPADLGTIPAGGLEVLDTTFSGAFVPLGSYALSVEGTFAVAGTTYCFALGTTLTVPPAAPGSGTLGSLTVPANQVSGAPFPPQPREPQPPVHGSRWTVPTGPFVPGVPTPDSTFVQPAPAVTALDEFAALAGPIVFRRNDGVGFTSGVSTIAEPSGGASGGGVIFVTANWRAAYSTDGGNTFTPLNPTTIFPNDAVGFCCDQIVQYIPSIDRFVWLIQGNGYRLAAASPAQIISSGGTAWTYWNLTAQVFGQPNGTGMDYPDLSVGNNQLYMSWDVGWPACPAGCRAGFQVARTSFAGIQAAGTITIEFTDPPDGPMAWGSHLMQDTADEIFWAGHNSNSQMRIFSLAENSNTYFWRDRGVSSWANNALSSITPDGMNWLAGSGGFPGNAVIGATRSGNQLWFAWNAGTNSSFQRAHIEMAVFDRGNNFNKTQQVQIWNNDYAFGYPSLSTNTCTGEIGLSFEFGGGGNYENHVVGFWGDFVAYITTGSNVGTTRYGDYVSIRRSPPTVADPGNLFAAFGYGLSSGTAPDVRYVSFGRPPSSCIIIK
jgi:hypothetical protein